jgi:hypothetical protein
MVRRMYDVLLDGEPAEVSWVDLDAQLGVPVHG